jgi:predicted RND superfamily exporter protein
MSSSPRAYSLRRPHVVLALFIVLGLVAAGGLLRLKQEEDLMVFLPAKDPDVALFQRVAQRFGALRVALIGVEAPGNPSDHGGLGVFAPSAMSRIFAASAAFKNVHGVDRVVSLGTLTDVVSGAGGAEVRPLVPRPPTSDDEARMLRDKVLARSHVVGQFVSHDAQAALLLVFLAEGAGDRQVVMDLRRVATQELAPLKVYFGGAPFAGRAIYEEAQADIWRLSPAALFVLLLVVLLAFSDPVAVLLTIVSVAFAILTVLGLMGYLGEHFTVATSTLPVILFASGNSYAVHVLGRYYLLRGAQLQSQGHRRLGRAEVAVVVQEALDIVRAPVAIAAVTTAIGFFSFVITDVRPMRAFGIACGAGVLLCWITALTLVPAVMVIWPRSEARPIRIDWMGELLVRLSLFARRHRLAVGLISLIVGVAGIAPMLRVSVRMEPRTFFRQGSEPWLAQQFLDQRFGGATFLQVAVNGDLDDPATLRAVAQLEDFSRALPGVTQVSSILEPLRLVSDVMGGGKRLPSTAKQAANLYFFLEGEAGIRALLAEGRRQALVQVRLRGDSAPALKALEDYMRGRLSRVATAAELRASTLARLADLGRAAGHAAPAPRALEQALDATGEGAATGAVPGLRKITQELLAGEEAPKLDEAGKTAVLEAVDRDRTPQLDEVLATVKKVSPSPDDADLFHQALLDRMREEKKGGAARALAGRLALAAGLAESGAEVKARLLLVAEDALGTPTAEPARAPLTGEVSGEPILDRGFSRSVSDNQLRSLILALVLVLVTMLALFRSVRTALVCMYPAVLTLVTIFGVMGHLGVHIDLGTSLVAGITTGAGADFAMHYLWYLRRSSLEEVSRTVGPVMVVSILLVALGFWILALGQAPVMRLFGTMAGASMAVSALYTCLLVPALLNTNQPARP